MSELYYPTRNGISIPINEIELPDTRLNIDKKGNTNRHHNEWTARTFGKNLLLTMVRNIETNQFVIPIDTHVYLHELYEPPKPPTARQAIAEIERAKYSNEMLCTKAKGHYEFNPISDIAFKQCLHNYNQLKHLYN